MTIPPTVVEALREIVDLDWQELNLSNFDEDDVAQLNEAAIRMHQIALTAYKQLQEGE